MDDEKKLGKIFKWVSIVALLALPIVVFVKKQKTEPHDRTPDEESDIFAAELEE